MVYINNCSLFRTRRTQEYLQ